MRQLHRERPWLYPNQHYVIDADVPDRLTITASVIRNDWLTVQNLTTTDMTIFSENAGLLFRYNSMNFVDSIPLPAGGIVFIVFAYCDETHQGYFAASAATGSSGDPPGPSGDFLPRVNPGFAGALTGPEANLGTLDADNATFSMNPVLRGTLATAELSPMALITKDQVFDVLNGTRTSSVGNSEDALPGLNTPSEEFEILDVSRDIPNKTFELILAVGQIMQLKKSTAAKVFVDQSPIEDVSNTMVGPRLLQFRHVRTVGGENHWYIFSST